MCSAANSVHVLDKISIHTCQQKIDILVILNDAKHQEICWTDLSKKITRGYPHKLKQNLFIGVFDQMRNPLSDTKQK